MGIIGYKGVTENLESILGSKKVQFKVGETYEEKLEPMTRKRGIHFCLYQEDVQKFVPNCKHVLKVLALGNIEGDGLQYATNKIQILEIVK